MDGSTSNPNRPNVTTTATMTAVCGPYIVHSPPIKKQMISGHLLPTLRSATAISMLQQPKRQISIVVYTNTEPTTTTSTPSLNISHLQDDDRVMVRICRLASELATTSPKNNDEHTTTDFGSAAVTGTSTPSAAASSGNSTHWVEHKLYRLEEVQVLKQRKDSIEVQLGLGNDTIVRDFKFVLSAGSTTTDANVAHFCSMLLTMKQLEQRRALKLMEQYKLQQQQKEVKPSQFTDLISSATPGGTAPATAKLTKTNPKIQLLVEIVSITNLPVTDLLSTDAYVVVRLGAQEIHRTSVISRNLSPIFTLLTGSLFTIVYPSVEEFFRAATSGLSLTIKDYDSVGSNDLIGTVQVPIQHLLNGTGQRIPFPIELANIKTPNESIDELDTSLAKKKKKAGVSHGKKAKVPTLYLRYKQASQHDIDFIQEFMTRSKQGGKFNLTKRNSNVCGIYASETFLSIRLQSLSHNMLNRHEKRNANKEMMYRVKPCPDSDRPIAETEWMTKEEIKHEALQPSSYWIQAGNGNLGKVYLEIIGCDNLPNMDVGNVSLRLPQKDKTDAFACIVYEDVIVNTDVIANTLSPRWMPWCHRAFAFNVLHPSSDVFIGIFDHDSEHNPLHKATQVATSSLHDPIGRIVVNLAHFKPDTVYLLEYPLYFGELKEHRMATRGTVTVRLRLEFPNVTKAILGGVNPPPPSTVSVSRRIDFNVAHYTTDGIIDDRAFSLDTLSRYVEELQTYQNIVEYVNEAFLVIWLWRGHYPIELAGKTYKLPIHSITAYTWAILVTWNWNRFPAFCAFSVAWILLATNEYQTQHPSRWRNCPTYYSILDAVIRNKSSSEFIQSNSNKVFIEQYELDLKQKLQRIMEEKKKEAEHEAELQEELGQEIEAAEAAEEVGRKRGGILTSFVPEHPLKGVLFPIQKQLREIVFGIRIVKTVIVWKEAYYAFWLTTAALAASVATFWIPWSFLLRWIFRLIAVVAFGPWMAIVDHKYFKVDPNLSDAERDKMLRQKLRNRYEEVVLSATNYFQRKERALKLASMKKYMFGQYSVRVPQFCEDLFDDIPTPSSSCYPYDPSLHQPIQFKKVVFGQALKGDMIPARESEMPKILKAVEQANSKRSIPVVGQTKKRQGENAPLLVHENESMSPTTYESIKKPL